MRTLQLAVYSGLSPFFSIKPNEFEKKLLILQSNEYAYACSYNQRTNQFKAEDIKKLSRSVTKGLVA